MGGDGAEGTGEAKGEALPKVTPSPPPPLYVEKHSVEGIGPIV